MPVAAGVGPSGVGLSPLPLLEGAGSDAALMHIQIIAVQRGRAEHKEKTHDLVARGAGRDMPGFPVLPVGPVGGVAAPSSRPIRRVNTGFLPIFIS